MEIFPCFAEGCKLTWQYSPDGRRIYHNGSEATRFISNSEAAASDVRLVKYPNGATEYLRSVVVEFFEQAHEYERRKHATP